MNIKGIDVSKHQGAIDWAKVKAAGAKFVMIRAGYTHYEGGLTVDGRFAANMQGAASVGLDVGVYVYSYDKSAAAAKLSAQRLVEIIKPYKLTYPVAFDIEDALHTKQSKALNTAICKAFLDEIEAAGYYGSLYSYTNFIATYLDDAQLKRYDKWVADYRSKCGYPGSHGMWQYTGSGKCDGITGDVDWNECFRDYPEIIRKAGLNRLAESGKDDTAAKLQEALAQRDAAVERAERAETVLREIQIVVTNFMN